MVELKEKLSTAILSTQLLVTEINKAEQSEPNQTNPFYRQYQNKRKWK